MLWIEAFHIIAVICWFAALFYLPRLYVYHAMAEDRVSQERFKVMERKLYWGIMTPSAVATVALGIWLISIVPAYLQAGWLHAKLLAVALLIVYHIACWWFLIQFREDRNQRSHVFYRYFNELPVVLLVAIVILAVVKPF